MNISVIGCGYIFKVAHGPALEKYRREKGDIVLNCVCDPNEDIRKQIKSVYGFKKDYSSIEEMLDKENTDAALLLVPPQHTVKYAKMLLEAGIPSLIEKPPGSSLGEAYELADAAEKSGVYHHVAFNRRSMLLVKDFVKAIKGENIKYINLDFMRYLRPEDDFHVTAIHGIDTCAYIAGSAFESIDIVYVKNQTGGDDYLLSGKLENGAIARLNFMPMTGTTQERFTVSGENILGNLYLPVWSACDYPGRAVIYRNETSLEITRPETEMFITNGFYQQLKDFIYGIESDAASVHTVQSCLQSMEVMEALKNKLTKYTAKA